MIRGTSVRSRAKATPAPSSSVRGISRASSEGPVRYTRSRPRTTNGTTSATARTSSSSVRSSGSASPARSTFRATTDGDAGAYESSENRSRRRARTVPAPVSGSIKPRSVGGRLPPGFHREGWPAMARVASSALPGAGSDTTGGWSAFQNSGSQPAASALSGSEVAAAGAGAGGGASRRCSSRASRACSENSTSPASVRWPSLIALHVGLPEGAVERAGRDRVFRSSGSAGGRGQLLPFVLFAAGAPALHGLADGGERAGDGGKEEELPELAAFLLFVLPHGRLLESWAWMDSNHRPHPYQGCALTA